MHRTFPANSSGGKDFAALAVRRFVACASCSVSPGSAASAADLFVFRGSLHPRFVVGTKGEHVVDCRRCGLEFLDG
jgi:hypothetical protein